MDACSLTAAPARIPRQQKRLYGFREAISDSEKPSRTRRISGSEKRISELAPRSKRIPGTRPIPGPGPAAGAWSKPAAGATQKLRNQAASKKR